MPDTFCGCYWWNGGDFPYVHKNDLQFASLINEFHVLKTVIKGRSVIPGPRFRFSDSDRSVIEDANGVCCIWRVVFDIEVIGESTITGSGDTGEDFHKPNVFVMRWNPAISSFTLDEYEEARGNCPEGFALDWSIYDWKEARKGDLFYMVRVGEGNTGVVFRGIIWSEAYTDKDWADSNKQRRYVEIVCYGCKPSCQPAWITMDELNASIPEIDWANGHSGVLVSNDIGDKLEELWNGAFGNE